MCGWFTLQPSVGKAALGSGRGPSGAVLRAPGVAVAPSGRAGTLSCGRPASGPRAEWAGTTAPRSRGALRPAAPGAGGYKWSGGSPGRLSPPRVAAAFTTFGPSSLKKKIKEKKTRKRFKIKKKKERKKKKKTNPLRRNRGEVTFARFRPARRSAPGRLSVPVRRSGGEPPARPRPRAAARLRRVAAPRPPPSPPARRPPHTTCPRCPSPARRGRRLRARAARGLPSRHRQIFGFPLPRAAVILNRREPEAYIYRETRVPEAAVGTAGLPLEIFLSFGGESPF